MIFVKFYDRVYKMDGSEFLETVLTNPDALCDGCSTPLKDQIMGLCKLTEKAENINAIVKSAIVNPQEYRNYLLWNGDTGRIAIPNSYENTQLRKLLEVHEEPFSSGFTRGFRDWINYEQPWQLMVNLTTPISYAVGVLVSESLGQLMQDKVLKNMLSSEETEEGGDRDA